MRKCWNRQTGTFEVRVSMTCGFKSHLPHQKEKDAFGRLFLFGALGSTKPAQRTSLCPDETRKTTLTVFFHTIFPSEGAGLSRYYRPSFSFWRGGEHKACAKNQSVL